MDPRVQLAFQFASDIAKQLITLALGVLALSVTFVKDLLKNPTKSERKLLIISWFSYLVSILFGVGSLMALTGSLAPLHPQAPVTPVTEIGLNARIPAALQIILFAGATFAFVIVGTSSLGSLGGSRNGCQHVSAAHEPAMTTGPPPRAAGPPEASS